MQCSKKIGLLTNDRFWPTVSRLTDDPRSQCCRQDYVLIVHATHQVFGVLDPHHLNPFCKWEV